MERGSIVIAHLTNPSEKYWGVLETIAVYGVTLRCLNVESFDDWTRAIAYEDTPSIGLATIFFPMGRIERMFLDEPMGEAESLSERFERRAGRSLESYFDEAGGGAS